jgi:hypothetical protein
MGAASRCCAAVVRDVFVPASSAKWQRDRYTSVHGVFTLSPSPVSAKKTRQNQNLKPGSGLIRTDLALATPERHIPTYFIKMAC